MVSQVFKRQYIRQILQEVTSPITRTQQPYMFVKAPTWGDFHLLPDIFFFDPITQFNAQLKCRYKNHKDAEILVTQYWTDYGQGPPRLIYGLSRNAYLVARYYKCSACNKLIRSSNPYFVRQLPSYPVFDFVLYNNSGVSSEVYNTIVTDIVNGVPFARIAKKFRELRKIDFSQHLSPEERSSNQSMEPDAYRCLHATHVADIFMHYFR